MAVMKNSEFLDRVLEKAKSIGPEENKSITAERFIVAVIDMVQNIDEIISDAGLCKSLLGDGDFSLVKPREELIRHINSDTGLSFSSILYWQNIIMKARENSVKCDFQMLDANIVLVHIFKQPNNIIKEQFGLEEGTDRYATINRIYESLFLGTKNTDIRSEEDSRKDDTSVAVEDVLKEEKSTGDLIAMIKGMQHDLKQTVFGQDNAINIFSTSFFQANLIPASLKNKKAPSASFLFAGPPGVGKTHLAQEIARVIDDIPFKRFDMSGYSDKEANLLFAGFDKTYKDSKEGEVTGYVRKNPRSVILFDEIEKAHINVIHLFLQLLDSGFVHDRYHKEDVSFKDTIVIMTTNAGRPLYEDSDIKDFSAVSRKVILKALERDINPQTGEPYFPAAICSRFAAGNVVMFNHITAHSLKDIAKKEIQKAADLFNKEKEIKVEIDEDVYSALLFSEGSTADARTIKGRAETFFHSEIYELFRLIVAEKVKADISTLEKIRISVDLHTTPDTIRSMFERTEKTKILVFSDNETVALCKDNMNTCEVMGTQFVKEAVDIIKHEDISFIILDYCCNIKETNENLNIEDINSEGRDFFKVLRDMRCDLPIYFIENSDRALSEEEKDTFTSQGVRDFLDAGQKQGEFLNHVEEILDMTHQQACMDQLAKENKLISFETAQTISEDGKTADIRLFDFEMKVAVDAEDMDNIIGANATPDISFEDVIGAKEAKKELEYFVSYLKNPKKYMGTGVKAPRGVLLHGAPGTGKTMLAKAMAAEAGVTFIATDGNSFLKKYVGEGPKMVHDIFKKARKYAPSILFVDEIDAIAKERRGADGGSGGVEATLTAFLTEMDGFKNDPSKPVFVLAATNFEVEPGSAKSLDSAMMRRFDRRVYIDLPDKNDRIKFLNMRIENTPALKLSKNKLENVAMRSTGMSLAELDSIVELSLRSAIREGSTVVTDEIFDEAFETFNNGETKKWDEAQLERVARHEAGHTLISCLNGDIPSYLTIVARGNHGGYMQHGDNEGKAIYTKDELLSRIRTSLGGRAAEIVYYGEGDGMSTGAGGDLVNATKIAQNIVCSYGMDDEFGLAVADASLNADGNMSTEIRKAVNGILREQMTEAIRLISENKNKIDALVEQLMEKNHLTSDEIVDAIELEPQMSKITEEE